MTNDAVEKILESTEVVVEAAPKMIECGKAAAIAVGTFIAGVVAGVGGTKIVKRFKARKQQKKIEEAVEVTEDAKKILGSEE